MASDLQFEASSPCSHCGYDLRGHKDNARCPECGLQSVRSLSQAAMVRWVEHRLLDLWCIAVMQCIGAICALSSIAAIRQGQYAAVMLGLVAAIYMFAGTVWYAVLGAMVFFRWQEPARRMLPDPYRRRLHVWLLADGLLVVVPPALLLLFRSL